MTRAHEEEEEEEEEVNEHEFVPPPPAIPPPPPMCPIAFATKGSELEPTVRFLREFRDNVVLKSRSKIVFEKVLDIYYFFSPSIVRKMEINFAFKKFIKDFFVKPTVSFLNLIVLNIEKM